MSVLYLTSFGPDLYAGTGKKMLESFGRVRTSERILVCYENTELGDPKDPFGQVLQQYPFVDLYNLGLDRFLLDWLAKNKDIIPEHLGGKARKCNCPGTGDFSQPAKRHSRHRPRCHWSWMNRNASRWFRKVAAWRVASCKLANYIMWVDSDTEWRKIPTEKDLAKIASGHAMCYARRHRTAIESGILLFNNQSSRRPGWGIIDDVCRRYTSGDFRQYDRWDDGYILTTVMLENQEACLDLVPKVWPAGRKETNNVMPTTVWSTGGYVEHYKGSHGSGLDIMK